MADTGHEGSMGDPQGRVLRDHSGIRVVVQEMRHARDLSELQERLREVRSLLESHFAFEEVPGGFFDKIRHMASQHLGRVDQFVREHRAFIDEIEGLAARARACVDGGAAEILREAGALAQRLNEHEARENVLLVDAMAPEIEDGGRAGGLPPGR